MKQPIQPLEIDEHGILRFKKNALVCHLLDHGGLDMNDLAMVDCPKEDREQFAQLIGYSHSGSSDLSYMTDATWEAVVRMYERGETEEQARIGQLEQTLANVRNAIRDAATAVFRVHPDDLFD